MTMRFWYSLVFSVVLGINPTFACTEVVGDRITGADMAAESAAFAGLEPAVDLGPAPLAGTTRSFLNFELQTLGERYGIALPEAASQTVCFTRASQFLTKEALTKVLEQAISDASASIKIVDFSRQALPLGSLEFDRKDLDTNGFWQGSLVYAPNRSVPVWARVQITDSKGEAVAFWPEALPPEVVPGDTVEVEVVSGGVVVGFKASAQGTGRRGESILVQNPASGNRFSATVQGPGRVRVEP